MLVRWESDDGDELEVTISLLSVSPRSEFEFIEVVPLGTKLKNTKVPGEPFSDYLIEKVFKRTFFGGGLGAATQPPFAEVSYAAIVAHYAQDPVRIQAHCVQLFFISMRRVRSTFCACTSTAHLFRPALMTLW